MRERHEGMKRTSIATCLLILGSALLIPGTVSAAEKGRAATFSQDIAPILQEKCQSCHRPEEMAPMPLRTYQEVRPWARSIRTKVSKREMPPWFIDRNVGIQQYKNDWSLSDAQIETIVKWVDAGAPEGNAADLPPTRVFPSSDGWNIGKPDLVVLQEKPFKMYAQGSDWSDARRRPRGTAGRAVEARQPSDRPPLLCRSRQRSRSTGGRERRDPARSIR